MSVTSRAASLAELLTHARKYYSDWAIANDMDSLLGEAPGEAAREALLLYARLRRNAWGFSPNSGTANSHSQIDAGALALLMPTASATGATCAGCGKGFVAARADKKTCSARCRKRITRRSHVTHILATGTSGRRISTRP